MKSGYVEKTNWTRNGGESGGTPYKGKNSASC